MFKFVLLMILVSIPAFAQHQSKKTVKPEVMEETREESRPAASHSKSTADFAAVEAFPDKGDMGISVAVPTGGNPTVGAAYWIENRLAAHVDFGLNYEIPSAKGEKNIFGFSIDANARWFLGREMTHLMPFLQPGLFFSKAAKNGSFGALMTIAPEFGVGAEYFFNKTFSISASTGASLSFKDNMKNIRLATGTTAISANFYWN